MRSRDVILGGVLLAVVIAALVIAGYRLFTAERAEWLAGTPLPNPRPVAEFALVAHDNRPIGSEVFKDRWSLAFLGFTHCPDICPTTLTFLSQLDARLRSSGTNVQVFLISADPQRDTPDVL